MPVGVGEKNTPTVSVRVTFATAFKKSPPVTKVEKSVMTERARGEERWIGKGERCKSE